MKTEMMPSNRTRNPSRGEDEEGNIRGTEIMVIVFVRLSRNYAINLSPTYIIYKCYKEDVYRSCWDVRETANITSLSASETY